MTETHTRDGAELAVAEEAGEGRGTEGALQDRGILVG
jgi:hypothetical protein